MARLRACDACSFRKVRCTGSLPCPTCVKAGFNCSFSKKGGRSGPKGPHKATLARVKKQLQSLRNDTSVNATSIPPSPPITTPPRDRETFTTSPVSLRPHPPAAWESSFVLSDVLAYLEIYNDRMYPVWPVIDSARLSTTFKENINNCEICALAFAVCASTSALLQLNSNNYPGNSSCLLSDSVALTDRFAAEAERYRLLYDYRESTTLEAILVPLFLHFYYGTKSKPQTTSFLLREAVTLCQLMGLDKEETYHDLESETESYRRRTFWLLYLTERGHAMQHGTGICLSDSIGLPSPDNRNEPQVLQAFNSLVHLFASVDGVLIDPKVATTRTGERIYSQETLLRIQNELRQHHEGSAEWNEVQRSDVAITRQWLRMLVWQLSLRNVSMSSEPTEDNMSFIYPAHVARDALQSISTVSMDAIVAHGPGMQIKICEITNTLLDVITCVHSLSPDMFIQTRQILHEFCFYLSRLSSNRGSLNWLQKRLAESKVPFQPRPSHLSTSGYDECYFMNESVDDHEIDDGLAN